MKFKTIQTSAFLLSACGAMIGCRGQTSENPPVHLNLNMDFQTNFKPQEENDFFADKRSMRPPVPGSVSRGNLHEDEFMYKGKVGANFASNMPVPLTAKLVERGQDRYNIYCTPCHGNAGLGNGIVVNRGMLRPPSFHDPRMVSMPVGQVYDAIANGVRGNMPAYGYAIPVEDRWAIVSYVKAIQLSQKAPLTSIPKDIIDSKGWKAR